MMNDNKRIEVLNNLKNRRATYLKLRGDGDLSVEPFITNLQEIILCIEDLEGRLRELRGTWDKTTQEWVR